MAKAGMRRPEPSEPNAKNQVKPVEELQGKAKLTKEKAKPLLYNNPTPKDSQ